ncbi:hypothetical protein B0H66DRAFT_518730 [Apodospora peruviana]|uniref:General negative regulator of transcription subunit 4 n=1 Tax=Apodospora peruviana TaxID=516989 RepID=A0AAE0I071_9PEZI|nr:hypothetical protein B0H66DRAFT_518730 [Apodospora peruviana]
MAPQDTYIDDEEEVCPLCIEEFDLSDRNFRPCPCGYQICQFCFNNIRQNMNSLCPACRRPYDEKTIQWKVVTAEEYAEFRANIQKNQKKRAADQRQKEVQKREAEKENRKNLVGVRVVQKNLVYVTGLTPTVREDELLKTLRKPEFFGQYGNIQKISISNRKSSDGQNQSLGIYVTFEKKEDAAKCIQAVNGSQNGDRVLRAQLGTTKYCSAWLRHEPCTNRQCMFLHELGDEEDSYTRQDLSSMNSINSQYTRQDPSSSNVSAQQSVRSGGASRSASRQQTHPSPAPAAAQPMVRSSSKDESENGDGSALPSSANWARNPQVRSRRGSHATSGAAPSPAISNALPVTAESAHEAIEEFAQEEAVAGPSTTTESRTKIEKAKRIPQDALTSLLKSLNGCTLAWPKVGDSQGGDAGFFPLFDSRGWEKRRGLRDDEDAGLTEEQDEPLELREPSEGEPESSGSLALGGEPEDQSQGRDGHAFDLLRRPSQPPIHRANDALFGPALGTGFGQATATLGSIGSRTVTPQQPAFMRPQGAFVDHIPPPGISAQANLFQGQGHNRQGSRFSFANDSRDTASSTSVKANPRIMAQQSSMMPSTFHNQPSGQYYASSTMAGPPPGLQKTGTPPNIFGQHGFGAAFGGGSKEPNEILQLLNRQPRAAGNQGHDAGKHEIDLLSLEEVTTSVDALVSDEPISAGIRQPPGDFESFGRSVTPSVPPGLGLPHSHASPAISHSSLHGLIAGRQTPPVALPILPIKPVAASASSPLKKTIGASGSDAKKNIKALAAESGLSKDIAKAKSQKILQDEDFPALNTPSKIPPAAVTPAVLPAVPAKAASKASAAGGSKKNAEKTTDKEKATSQPPRTNTPKPDSRANEKRPVPGILNIAAATKAAQARSSELSSTADKSAPDRDSAFPALPTPSATSASVSSPLARVAPKTLRVVSTPKGETPMTPATAGAPVSATASVRSAVAAAIRPETPASEMISDSASIISASISASRTNSPPPSKVGSAPVRTTTKSQQRKQRKEALKKDTESIAAQPVKAAEPEVEIAPIIGRKKKQKKEKEKDNQKETQKETQKENEKEKEKDKGKEKERSESLIATPTASRPETPAPQAAPAPAKEIKEVKEESSTYRSTANETTSLTEDHRTSRLHDMRAESRRLDTPESLSSSTPRYIPPPASILQELQQAGLVPDNIDSLPFFKPAGLQSDKLQRVVDSNNPANVKNNSMAPARAIVSAEDQATLLAGKPVRKVVDGTRILLTPNGDCVKNLFPEEEDRFLQLQDEIAETALSPAAFVCSRHETGGGFSLVKGRAVPNGPPGYFPQAPGAFPTDPVNKIQREEAITYINQYVLPRLNLNARDMSFPKAMSAWGPDNIRSGGTNAAAAAAANLGSLAPWFYGGGDQPSASSHHHDMVGGAGDDDNDAAAPELSYPGPVGSAFADAAAAHSYLDMSTSASVHALAAASTSKGGGGGATSSSSNSGGGAPGPFGNVPLMTLEDAEQALAVARKEAEKLEKTLNQLIKKNKKLLTMSSGAAAATAVAVPSVGGGGH